MNTKRKKEILLAAVLLLAVLLGTLVFLQQKKEKEETIENAGRILSAEPARTALEYKGKSYPIRKNLDSILLIGTDESEERYNTNPSDDYSYNYGMADFQVLLVFDNAKKTVTPIQINRDTIADVPWIAVNGGIGGYERTQITYAFSYGSGGTDSCENTADAVSRFLFDAPIAGYLQFTMDAVPIVNDLIGGVTLRLPKDIPELGEEYVKDAVITLKGKNALRFIQYRDRSRTDANAGRMERHRLYLDAFIPQARSAYAKNENLALRVLEQIDPYLQTRMTANEITEMINRLSTYEIRSVKTYEGDYVLGQYAEFYPYEKSVWECVKTAFC